MGKPNRRRVRMSQFRQQIAEKVVGWDNLVEVEIADGVSVVMKIPVLLGDDDDFQERMQAATQVSNDAAALVMLGYHPEGVSAEDQLRLAHENDVSSAELGYLFGTEVAAARERLGNFRYAG